MNGTSFRWHRSVAGPLVLAAILAGSGAAQAQGVIGVSGSAATVTKTDHLALIGSVTFSVSSGTTVAGTIEVNVTPIKLTNAGGAGITLNGTGGFTGATISSIIPDFGLVIIAVPAGAGPGSTMTLSGMRFSAADTGIAQFNARIGLNGNQLPAGQNTVLMVQNSADGLVIDPTSDNSFSFVNGTLLDPLGQFIFAEGWAGAFSSQVGQLGQTVATQVIIQVTGLPDNATLNFPATVTAPSGATLNIQGGVPIVFTNLLSPNRVIYEFADSINGSTVVDGFSMSIPINTTGNVGSGTVFLQATLGPIGASTPSAIAPSTAVPRYAENFLPNLVGSVPTTRTISFPITHPTDSTRLVVSNPATGGAFMTIRARQSDGTLTPGLSNPFNVNLPARSTSSLTLQQMFGASASTSNVASIEVEAQNDRLVGVVFDSVAQSTLTTHRLEGLNSMYLPFDRKTASDMPVLTIMNDSALTGTVGCLVRNSAGQTVVNNVVRALVANGVLRDPLTSWLGVPASQIPLEGYVLCQSSIVVRARLINNPTTNTDQVFGFPATSKLKLNFPFFAFGEGYDTAVTVINSANLDRARVTLTLFGSSGSTIGTPFQRTVEPQERAVLSFRTVFPGLSGLAVGYFSMDVERIQVNPFSSPPQIAGMVRITNGGASTVAPLIVDAAPELVITPTVESATEFTGLAMLNTTTAGIDANVELLLGGNSRGSSIVTVPATGNRLILVREVNAAFANHSDGFVRITAPQPGLACFAFRGTLSLSGLTFIRAQTSP